MQRKTEKLYYEDLFLAECEATIVEVCEKGVVCDGTVAFPEGGGQEGDQGTLIFPGPPAEEIPFLDTQKGLGRPLIVQGFPTIQVDTPVYHVVEPARIDQMSVGTRIRIRIDVDRRVRLTVNHSGLHLVLMGIEDLRPGASKKVKGCHIGTDHARIDFSVDERFTQDDLQTVKSFVNALVDRDLPITLFHHPGENEAWYWKCLDATVPCGGTHLPATKYVGHVNLKRKRLGKGQDRIIATFPDAVLPVDLYHAD